MISLHAVVLIDIAKKQAETVYRANKQTANKNVETLTNVAASYLTIVIEKSTDHEIIGSRILGILIPFVPSRIFS